MPKFHVAFRSNASDALREFAFFKRHGFIVSMTRVTDGWKIEADPSHCNWK